MKMALLTKIEKRIIRKCEDIEELEEINDMEELQDATVTIHNPK